jgi:chromosome segregation ATPase
MLQSQFDKVEELTTEVKDLSSQVIDLSTELQTARDLIATLKKDKRELKDRFRASPQKEVEDELKAMRTVLAGESAKVRQAKNAIVEQDAIIASLDQQIAKEKSLKVAAEIRQTELEEEVCQLKLRTVQLESSCEKFKAQCQSKASESRPPFARQFKEKSHPIASQFVTDVKGNKHYYRASLLSASQQSEDSRAEALSFMFNAHELKAEDLSTAVTTPAKGQMEASVRCFEFVKSTQRFISRLSKWCQ